MDADYEEKMEKEERDKERAKGDAPSPSSSEYTSPSSSSYHSNEEINQSLQAENAKLRRILQEAKEENHILKLQLQAT